MKAKKSNISIFALTLCLGLLLPWMSFAKESLQNKRVVIFYQESFPASGKDILWYKESLKDLGLDVTVAGAKELSNASFLTKERFDTLILPDGYNIPFEAGYSIPNFLAEGGNVITSVLPKWGIKYDLEKRIWKDKVPFGGGRRSELQIRFLPWKWAKRSLNTTLKLNPNLSPLFKKLPPTVGPFNNSFGLPDKMNYHRLRAEGWGSGDGDISGGPNIETAANIIFPIYLLPNGEPADFIAYRYHSNYFNDSTLVILGNLGSSLMNTTSARDILYASLKVCEIRFPKEEEPSYYERVIRLQREVSAFGKLFVETSASLRDIAFCKFYQKNKKEFEGLKEKISQCEKTLSYIIGKKQSIDKLLVLGSDTKEQDKRRKRLLSRLYEETEKLQIFRRELAEEIKKINYPREIRIRNLWGQFIVDAGITKPISLYTLRHDFFQSLKEIGANAYYPQHETRFLHHYLDDPIVRKNAEGIKFDIYSPSILYPEIIPSQGILNPVTGEVKETKRQVYRYKRLEKRIADFISIWKDKPVVRYIAGCREGGLGVRFWGEQAREEYQEYLKKKYKEIETLNRQWKADYKKFEEIKLLTKMPKSISEHSNWEDWTNFREKRYLSDGQWAYDTFKKYDPKTPLSNFSASEHVMGNTLCGLNFYQLTKLTDISGVDGTRWAPTKREWVWLDLNCGKPFFTGEWSQFYISANHLKGRRLLCDETWKALSGGMVGINLWVWRMYGRDIGNYVDTTGLPTLYGWQLKSLVTDINRFDHILLDGKRREPQIRILFSDTSRCHQGWGVRILYLGVPNSHRTATTNFYMHFLRSHIPARAVAEEAILEGADLSEAQLLIVPQAEYLSEELQERLLDYVRDGGNILLEGKVGQHDNYGHPCNLLFKEAGVVPSVVRTKEILLPEGEIYLITKPKLAFSPALFSPEKAKVLLSYTSEEPALISIPLGKGKLLISGAPFGFDYNTAAASLIMKKVTQEINLTPRYICLDKKLLIRDWEYRGKKYLICAYRRDKGLVNNLKRFRLKVKGNYKVVDYLLGTEIPSHFDGNYTSFYGIILSPGGRVYQLNKASSLRKVSLSWQTPTGKISTLGSNLSSSPVSLPFKGELRVNEPKTIDGFLFQADVVALTDNSGEAYLTVSKRGEKVRRKVEPNREYCFSFKKNSFLVKCLSCHFVMPLGIRLEVKGTERKTVASICSLKKEDYFGHKSLVLSNGLIEARILPESAGRIIELITCYDKTNHLKQSEREGHLIGGIDEIDHGWPGSFYNQSFSYQLLKNTPEEIKILLRLRKPVKDLMLEKILTLKKGEYKLRLEIKEYNYAKNSRFLSLHLQPELSIGGSGGVEDAFFIPMGEEVEVFPYFAGGIPHNITASRSWAACADRISRLYLIISFSLEEVERFVPSMLTTHYNLSTHARSKEIQPHAYLPLNVNLSFVKGIPGISNYSREIASYLALPGKMINQSESVPLTVELATDSSEEREIKGEICLYHTGKKLKELANFGGIVSFEKPMKKSFSFSWQDLADGKYEISLILFNKKGGLLLSTKKGFSLIGNQKKKNLEGYEKFKRRLKQLKGKYPSRNDELFQIFVSLEKFRAALEENSEKEILLKKEEINQALKGIK